MENSYLDLNFEIIKRADISRHANGKELSLINLGPIALIDNFKLTTSSGNHSEDIGLAHFVSLFYQLITSAEDIDDLFFGFDRDRGRRRDELTDNKILGGKCHLKVMLKIKFGFA